MSLFFLLALLTAVGYEMSRQIRRHEAPERRRFSLAVGYTVAGIGVDLSGPPNPVAVAMLVIGMVASVVFSVAIGLICGEVTDVWMASDGVVWSCGNPRTLGLFVGLLAITGGIAIYAEGQGVHIRYGFGDVMLAMAIVVAIQAEMIHLRALALIRAVARIDLAY